MIQDDTQSHQLSGEPTFDVRDLNAGYTNKSFGGENIDAYGTSGFNIHSAFAVDFGNAGSNYGHRTNMMDSEYREVGIAVVADTRTGVQLGPLVATEDFGARFNMGNPWLVGVVYNDANHNGRYDAGEGLSGVSIQITGTGGTFSTTTMTAGGYQISSPGSYQVTASGGQLAAPAACRHVQRQQRRGRFRARTQHRVRQLRAGQPGHRRRRSSTTASRASGPVPPRRGPPARGSTAGRKSAPPPTGASKAGRLVVLDAAGRLRPVVTYTAGSNLTTKLGLDLYDGVGHWLGQALVNEQLAPTDFTDQGVGWNRLCTVKLTNNIFHVSTWNSPTDGAIEVDAIQLRAAPWSTTRTPARSPAAARSRRRLLDRQRPARWAAATSAAAGGQRIQHGGLDDARHARLYTWP